MIKTSIFCIFFANDVCEFFPSAVIQVWAPCWLLININGQRTVIRKRGKMQLKQKTNPALRPLRPILQLTGADILCHGMISYFLRCARLSPLCHGILYFIPTHWYHHVQIAHWSSLFSSHMNGCTGVNLNQYYCWPIFQKFSKIVKKKNQND